MRTQRAPALAGALLTLLATSARADDAPGTREVKIPTDALSEVIKRHPRGRMLTEEDWKALLKKAGIAKISELTPPEAAEAPPVPFAVENAEVVGEVAGEQASFTAECTVRILETKTIVLPLPLLGVGAREVSVDGAAARLTRNAAGHCVLLDGPGERRITWRFSVAVEKLEERGAGAFFIPLMKSAVAARLRVTLPGDVEVASPQAALEVQRAGGQTLVEAACGRRDVLRLEWRPRTPEAPAVPYVAVEDACCFVVRRGLVQLDLACDFQVYRAGVERFAIDLPPGFAVRTLESFTRDDPTAPPAVAGATWVQKGDRVELAVARPRTGELAVVLRAEFVSPQEGKLELKAPSYPNAARSSGFIGIARGEDMNLAFEGEKNLERADLDSLPAATATGLRRVYRRGNSQAAVALAVKPVEPRVGLTLVGLEELREKEVHLLAIYRFHVLEGKVYQFEAQLPESFRVVSTEVANQDGVAQKHELRTISKDGKTRLLVELEGGLREQQELVVTVRGAREVPTGIASEKDLTVPALAGVPATTTTGYIGVGVDPAFRVRGDVSGLLPLPVEALATVGLGVQGLALGFRVDRPDYSGALVLARKETRVAAKTLVYHQIDERTIQTDARFEFDVTGAPVESLELSLPEGAGKLARIDGEGVSERALVETKDGRERWRVGFQSPVLGPVVLFVHFDTQVKGFDKAEGAAQTTLDLPRVHAGEGTERERGTLAVFSSDSTEISGRPLNLHPVEGTEVPAHPQVKPAGRPLFAFSYAGTDWSLGLDVVRHAPASVLSAIVEQLSIESSVGKDGVGRHVATFELKNLSHQFFHLRVPQNAQIWSVLVDGEGVKPAEDAGSKIVPITKSGSPDKPLRVTVSYEVREGALGTFGKGALEAPALLLRRDAEAVPVLKTSWKLSLPDDFRYVEFSGNADGPQAAVDRPLVAQAWSEYPDVLIECLAVLVLVLGIASSERARTSVLAAGASLVNGLLAGAGAVRRRARFQRPRVATVVGALVLGLVVTAIAIPNLVQARKGAMSPVAYERARGFVGDNVTAAPRPQAPAAAGPMEPQPVTEADKNTDEETLSLPLDRPVALGRANRGPMAPPPPPPAPKPGRPMNRPASGEKKKALKRDEAQTKEAADGKALPKGAFSFDDDETQNDGEPQPNKPVMQSFALGKGAEGGKDAAKTTTSTGGPIGGEGETTRVINTKNEATPEKVHHQLAASSAFGEKGLRSLAIDLPNVGATRTFVRDGGPAAVSFSYVNTGAWRLGLVALATLGFVAGVVLPRKTRMGYTGLLVLSLLVLQTLPSVVAPSLTGAPVNAFVAGLLLAGPVAFLLAVERVRARRIVVKSSKVAALFLGVLLLAPSTAQAEEPKAPRAKRDRTVFVPYDPEHPEKKQNTVFVPEDVYDELWHKANPDAKASVRVAPPAAYAVSAVSYEGTVSGEGLALKATFRVEILQEGWVEAPLGLEGAGIRSATIAPEGARVVPAASGYVFIAQGPKTFDVTLDLLVPRSGDTYSVGAVRVGAAVAKIGTPEDGKAIKVLGALGGQVERPRAGGGIEVEASLGSTPTLKVAFGPREAITHGGGSEASARSETVYSIRRGRVEVVSRFTFEVSGEGREGFLFTVPAGLEVTQVATEALRSWRVTNGVLEIALRRPSGRRAEVVIHAERASTGTAIELPELEARNVSRDEGRFGVGVESGLRVRFGAESQGLRQVDPSDLAGTAQLSRTPLVERGYAFSKRPAKAAVELLEDALELKASSRVLGIVRADRYEVRAELEYQVKRGRTFELRVLAPEGLELDGDPTGLDVRERLVEKVAGGVRYTFGLAKALVAPATAVLRVTLAQTLRQEDVKVAVPDVRALGVTSEDGELALAAGQGIRLRGDVEADRFASTDPESAARRLGSPADAKAQLGWTRRPKATAGLSTKTIAIEHPAPHVEGTVVTFATVERDVVRTVARVYYDLSEAGSKTFKFGLPARLAKRVSIAAPNQREVTFAPLAAEGSSEERVQVTVELQSAVENFYEVALDWEELVPPSGQVDLVRLELLGCDRARGFVLVQADPSLTEKMELARERSGDIERARPEQAFALPPGKDPRDFGDFCFRTDKPTWRIGLDLKKVETQAPAPARVETAHVTTVVRDDGGVVHKAVYRVRNRSLQFLALKLPKGADVWTVHVGGEPKRMHREGELTLIPLPKRADADMGFEVEVVYRTQLDGPLGFLTKVAPQAPVLATKDVQVERTFWSVFLPPRFDAMSWTGNVEETDAAVGEVESLKAKVRELAKLNEIAQSGAGSNERQIALDNLTSNYAQVQQAYSIARSSLAAAQSEPKKRSAQVAGQLAKSGKELAELEQALQGIERQQQQRVREKGKAVGTTPQQQLEVVYQGTKFQANAQDGWKVNVGAFKQDRGQAWAGFVRNGDAQNALDLGVTLSNDANVPQQSYSQNRAMPQQQMNLGLDQQKLTLRRSSRNQQPTQQGQQGTHRDAQVDLFVPFHAGNADVRAQVAQAERERSARELEALQKQVQERKGRQAKADTYFFEDAARKAEKAGDLDRARQLRELVREQEEGGELDGKLKSEEKKPEPTDSFYGRKPAPATPPPPPADAPAPEQPMLDPSAVEGRLRGDEDRAGDSLGVGGGSGGGGRFGGRRNVPVQRVTLGESLERAEAQKALLSIGFRFETPAGVEPLHFTTASNVEEMQVAVTVAPRKSLDTAGRVARALVVVLVLVTVARLGLLRREEGKTAAKTLGLIAASSLAGLAFVHPAFAGVAVLASLLALVKARS